MTLSRAIGIITREFYTMKIGFQLKGDNVKVFYHKRDIIEVRLCCESYRGEQIFLEKNLHNLEYIIYGTQ